MSVLTNLVRQNLILNKRRTIVTIISIILSCALIGGVATLIGSFQKFMQDTTIEATGNYEATFNNVPVDKEKYIENNAYIETEMRSADIGYTKLDGSKNVDKPYLFIMAYDQTMFTNMPLKLLEGRIPKNSNEMVISSHIENDGGVKYNVGDTVTLDIGQRYIDGEVLNQNNPYNYSSNNVLGQETLTITSTHTYKIVGIIDRPSIESYGAAGYTVITYLDKDALGSINRVNISVITKNPNDIYDKLNNVADEANLSKDENGIYDIEYNDSLLRWYGVTDNDNANTMLYGFAGILIVVIMIASIIVIYNSFNISITERKKQFGMLSSIGTTSKQIRNMVLKEGFLLSIIGIPLGILSSIVGIGITLNIVNGLGIFDEYFQSRLTLTVSPLSIFITVIFGGLTIFLSSLIPAIKASKTSPIEAIRLSNDIKIKGRKLKTSKFTRKIFGIEGELGLKNMKRNRKKYRSTIISLFVSIVLFMTVNSFAEYSFRSALKVYNEYTFNVGVSGTEKAITDISKLDYVDRYAMVKSVNFTLYTDEDELNDKIVDDMKQSGYDEGKHKYIINVALSTLGDTEFKRYLKENGEDIKDYIDPSNPKMIMIDKSNFFSMNEGRYYQLPLTNIKENDKITLTSGEEISKELNVGEIVSNYPMGFSNADSYDKIIQGFISNEVYDSLDASLKTDETWMLIQSSDPAKLMTQIEALSKANGVTVNAQNIDEQVKIMNNIILAISIFLYGFITLVSLITITNVINTITTSIYLRRREFAMLKAIGMTNKDFNKMIRFESAFYGLKSLLYGLPMGILIDYFMYTKVSSMFVYDYEIPLKPIMICVAFVIVIISITMAYSVRKIRNDNIIDVIKQENL